MSSAAEKGVSLVNKVDTKVLLIGGVVVIGAIAAYELLKGTSTSQSAGPTSGGTTSTPVGQNPEQSFSTPQSGSTSSTSPSYPISSSSSFTLPTSSSVVGSRDYTITSVYAPYNNTSNTDVVAPINTFSPTTNSEDLYAPFNYSATATNYNQKYQQKYDYTTGGLGSGLNINSNPSGFGSTIT